MARQKRQANEKLCFFWWMEIKPNRMKNVLHKSGKGFPEYHILNRILQILYITKTPLSRSSNFVCYWHVILKISICFSFSLSSTNSNFVCYWHVILKISICFSFSLSSANSNFVCYWHFILKFSLKLSCPSHLGTDLNIV